MYVLPTKKKEEEKEGKEGGRKRRKDVHEKKEGKMIEKAFFWSCCCFRSDYGFLSLPHYRNSLERILITCWLCKSLQSHFSFFFSPELITGPNSKCQIQWFLSHCPLSQLTLMTTPSYLDLLSWGMLRFFWFSSSSSFNFLNLKKYIYF